MFVQISQQIARDVARGRLRPGDRLPGSRTLAETLGVHRSTVVSAYAELAAQGWTETRSGGATLVAKASSPSPRRFAAHAEQRALVPPRTGFAIAPAPVTTPRLPRLPRGALPLWGGMPDLRLVPIDLLTRAYRRAARRFGGALLGYGSDPRGHEPLRAAIAEMVSAARGLAANVDSVMVTRGSQMALDLVARSLIAAGDVVAVEELGYAPALAVFRRAGAEVVPIRLDRDGIDVRAIERLAQQKRVRLVYVTPHHQYPTTVMLAPSRRLALLELARRERIAILEDDYDQEFHYDGRPVLPMASTDRHGSVIYIGTLAKILAPGLRLGFVVAPAALLERMAHERVLVDRQGDAVLEQATAELLEDGEIQRHVRRMRRLYERRRDALCSAFDEHLSSVVSYQRPKGGLALWAAVSEEIDLLTWQERCAEKGVFFQIASQFTFDGSAPPFSRFGYAMLDERELNVAARCMALALRGCRARRHAGTVHTGTGPPK